jgi:cellulose biosynthesis protein BcsQ
MVGLVITIAQRKGGAGKTTLATQFAVTWARHGARVAALDIDPQGSFSAWVDLRRARLGAKAIGFSNGIPRFLLAIAVGTPITGRPPHRTVRAAFLHTAPTSDV